MKSVWLAIALIPNITFSQNNVGEKLQGTWLCVNLVDSLGRPVMGEFGGPRNFLKFQFDGDKFFVALAPFDKGAGHRVSFKEDYFDLVNSPLNQKRYHVKSLTDKGLILETTSKNSKIYYRLVNAKQYSRDLDQISTLRVYDKLIIEIAYVKSAFGYYMSSYYLIDNSILNLLPSPVFIDKQYFSLGAYLEANLRIPTIQLVDLKDQETIFEFDVTENGIANISIAKKLGGDADFYIYDLIKEMSKKWTPLIVDGKFYDTRIQLKLSFTYVEK